MFITTITKIKQELSNDRGMSTIEYSIVKELLLIVDRLMTNRLSSLLFALK